MDTPNRDSLTQYLCYTSTNESWISMESKAKYIDYKQAVELTGLKKGSLYAMVSQKRVPHLRLGGRHVLFDREELMRWLEKHRVE